jgi:hypothetical protein
MRKTVQFIRELIMPRSAGGWFLLVPGILSPLALARDAFNVGLRPTLQKMLSYYDWVIDWLIGWAKPFIEVLLVELGFRIELFAHWKHILVLFNIYIVRSIANSFRAHRPTGSFRLVAGLLISAAVSVVAGTVPLANSSATDDFLLPGIPVIGLFFYGVSTGVWQATFRREVEQRRRGQTKWGEIFIGHLSAALWRTAIAFLVILAGALSPLRDYVPSAGLVVLVVLVIMHAIYNLRDGITQLSREPWHGSYWNTPSVKIGMDMLRYFIYAVIAVILGAGSP